MWQESTALFGICLSEDKTNLGYLNNFCEDPIQLGYLGMPLHKSNLYKALGSELTSYAYIDTLKYRLFSSERKGNEKVLVEDTNPIWSKSQDISKKMAFLL